MYGPEDPDVPRAEGGMASTAWSAEQPPDLRRDFNGDYDLWNQARDEWYTRAVGRQLPPVSDAQRDKEWTRTLNARSKRLKRAAETAEQGDERRKRHGLEMQGWRTDEFCTEVTDLAAMLTDEQQLDKALREPAVAAKRVQAVIQPAQRLMQIGRYQDAARLMTFALSAYPDVFERDCERVGADGEYHNPWAGELWSRVAERRRSKNVEPKQLQPDALRVIRVLCDACEHLELWDTAGHWCEVAAAAMLEAHGECNCDVVDYEVRSIEFEIKGGSDPDGDLMDLLFVRAEHLMAQTRDSRGRISELRERCLNAITAHLRRHAQMDRASRFLTAHASTAGVLRSRPNAVCLLLPCATKPCAVHDMSSTPLQV